MTSCDFGIIIDLLIKLILYLVKKSRENINISKTRKAFKIKRKTFVIIFKGLSVVRNCLRPESGPIIHEFLYFRTIGLAYAETLRDLA